MNRGRTLFIILISIFSCIVITCFFYLFKIWNSYKVFQPNYICNESPAFGGFVFFYDRCECRGSLRKEKIPPNVDPSSTFDYCDGEIIRRYKVFDLKNWPNIMAKISGSKEVKNEMEAVGYCKKAKEIGDEIYGQAGIEGNLDKLYENCLQDAKRNFNFTTEL